MAIAIQKSVVQRRMKPFWTLTHGDCMALMREMPECSVDAIVTDPPYGLEFMGKDWDRLGATVGEFAEQVDDDGRIDFHGKGNAPFGSGGQRVRYGTSARSMQEWHERWAREALRVLKPGGHLLAAGGSRTFHRLVCGLDDAGFEIRDCITHHYGSGFPKSLNVGKAIDKAARGVPQGGVDPSSANHGRYRTQATEGKRSEGDRGQGFGAGPGQFMAEAGEAQVRELVPEAAEWDGWGTALKPATEFWTVARKPLMSTVVANVLEHGTGGLNVDGCRVGTTKDVPASPRRAPQGPAYGELGNDLGTGGGFDPNLGRWPANVVLSHAEGCVRVGSEVCGGDSRDTGNGKRSGGFVDVGTENGDGEPNARVYGDQEVEIFACVSSCPIRLLDDQTRDLKRGGDLSGNEPSTSFSGHVYGEGKRSAWKAHGDSGGASRFFYCSKASSRERNEGLDHLIEANGKKPNRHPTVKPVDLMRWLVRLVTPPGGCVLDPFAGSGTTLIAAQLEGFNVIGFEREAEYVEIARARVSHCEKLWPLS